MEYITSIKDNIYPKVENYKKRNAVRAIVITKEKQIVLMHIKTNDIFGKRDHYELPGGGIDENENIIDALKREVLEETGFYIDNIKEIGIIDIEYNPLKRIDVQHYFLAYVTCKTNNNLTKYEQALFDDIAYVNIEEIIDFYNKNSAEGVGKLIHKRDLIAINKALKLINNEK